MDPPPPVPEEWTASYEIYTLFTYSCLFVIGKYVDVFQMGEGFFGGYFPRAKYIVGGGGGSGDELSRGNFTKGEFHKIHERNSFHLSYFLFGDLILHGETVWKNFQAKIFNRVRIFWGILLWRGVYSIEEIIHRRVITRINFPREKLSLGRGRGRYGKNVPHRGYFW